MASNIEMDLLLKRAVRLLHSSSTNSATELRQMLDDAIKQRYGSEKMLCKALSKQHLEEEKNFPGRVPTPPPQIMQEEDEVINLSSPAKASDSPDTIMDSDDGANSSSAVLANSAPPILTAADEDVNLKEFGDLNCCVCGEMMFTATNRLIECSKCGALYHQECHKPAISNEDATEELEQHWLCSICDKSAMCKTANIPAADIVVIPDDPVTTQASSNKHKSASSSSSNSSSPFYRNEQSSSKHKSHRDEHHSSSSKSSASNSSSSNIVTPSINVISAPDRNATHSKRSHSTSKSSRSRHESYRKKSNK